MKLNAVRPRNANDICFLRTAYMQDRTPTKWRWTLECTSLKDFLQIKKDQENEITSTQSQAITCLL